MELFKILSVYLGMVLYSIHHTLLPKLQITKQLMILQLKIMDKQFLL